MFMKCYDIVLINRARPIEKCHYDNELPVEREMSNTAAEIAACPGKLSTS